MSDVESESLPAHVSICQERYRTLYDRLDRVDARMEKIEHMLQEIGQQLDRVHDRHYRRWEQAQLGVIGVLVGIMGMVIAGYL